MDDSALRALIGAHVLLWIDLLDAAVGGDDDMRRIALDAWQPAVAAIEALTPCVVGPIDNWDIAAAALGLATTIIKQGRTR
jgi:hypothetical protein